MNSFRSFIMLWISLSPSEWLPALLKVAASSEVLQADLQSPRGAHSAPLHLGVPIACALSLTQLCLPVSNLGPTSSQLVPPFEQPESTHQHLLESWKYWPGWAVSPSLVSRCPRLLLVGVPWLVKARR